MGYLGNFTKAAILTGLGFAAAGCVSDRIEVETRNNVTRRAFTSRDGRVVDVIYDKPRIVPKISCEFIEDDTNRLAQVYMKLPTGDFYLEDAQHAPEKDKKFAYSECGALKSEFEKHEAK